MIAVVVVREGVAPLGAAEAVAEAGGRAVLVGTGVAAAAEGVGAHEVTVLEMAVSPAAMAMALAPLVAGQVVICPASPDGRDLAPRLAAVAGLPLLAGAVEVGESRVLLARRGGLVLEVHHPRGPFVATLVPGVRGALESASVPTRVEQAATMAVAANDAEVLEVLPPDVATMDLAEAPRIIGGGAGLDGPERLAQLAGVAECLGASVGVTRVVTDRGWIGHERQIGTTGVVVAPTLYVNFAISGAVQHTSGLGDPEHVISVNTDPHCPMMAMADLAIVSDANAVIDELARLVNDAGVNDG